MFTTNFDDYICTGDKITTEIDGFVIQAEVVFDVDYHIADNDCHSLEQAVTGSSEEQHKKILEAHGAWIAGEWWYGGLVLSVNKADVVLSDNAASIWGLEINYPNGDNSYLTEVANELLPEALEEGKRVLKTLLEAN